MAKTVIKIENLSKIYRLGEIGTGTISHDLNRWFRMNILGQDDPYAKIGHVNDRTQKAEKGELVAALRDINLEIKEGEVLGIIGKNGAGKSTLLKLLSRVTSPSTGTIKVKGRLASLLEVGTGFHPEMTGRENIYMNGTIMGMRKWEIDKKLDEIVDFAGIAKYLDTPVKRYSSGMTVRLGFAVAAHLEPEILVVDEVLAVGDAEFQKKAIGKMQDVSRNDGRTVLFVSHNMASIQNLCSSGVVLKNGTINFTGVTSKAISYYLAENRKEIKNNLLDIQDRKGDGTIKFKSCFIEDINGNIINNILTGNDVYLVFELEVNSKKAYIDLGFSIHDQNEDRISILYSSYQDKFFKTKDEKNISIKCKLSNFSFTEGNYFIYGRVLNNKSEADWPNQPIAKFSVENGDYYRTGNIEVYGKSRVLINGEWHQQ